MAAQSHCRQEFHRDSQPGTMVHGKPAFSEHREPTGDLGPAWPDSGSAETHGSQEIPGSRAFLRKRECIGIEPERTYRPPPPFRLCTSAR
jgi:hypothetical protein